MTARPSKERVSPSTRTACVVSGDRVAEGVVTGP